MPDDDVQAEERLLGMPLLLFRVLVLLVLAIPPLVVSVLVQQKSAHFSAESVYDAANYTGDAAFAIGGTVAAGRRGMDLLGCVIVGFTVALGGGTWRDLFLGATPVGWATAWFEPLWVIGWSLFTFCVARLLKFDPTKWTEFFFWIDAIGLAAFAASGAVASYKAADVTWLAAGLGGMFGATFGGMTRDVLCLREPRILYAHAEIYALPPLIGGLAYAMLDKGCHVDQSVAIVWSGWLVLPIRVLAVMYDLRLPEFPIEMHMMTADDAMTSDSTSIERKELLQEIRQAQALGARSADPSIFARTQAPRTSRARKPSGSPTTRTPKNPAAQTEPGPSENTNLQL